MGPKYVDHIIDTLEMVKPTSLVKIFAVFQVVVKTHQRNLASKCDYIVMEDLLWNKPEVSKIYDLKGSQRNRMTKEKESSKSEFSVLLDSNYLASMANSPIYLNKSAYLGKFLNPFTHGAI